LYRLLLEELPQAAVVSIAHRESVARYHELAWRFRDGALVVEKLAPEPA
jgi:putative ATP-binding cassette transporter